MATKGSMTYTIDLGEKLKRIILLVGPNGWRVKEHARSFVILKTFKSFPVLFI